MVLRLNACALYALCLDFLLERWQVRTAVCGTRLLYFNQCRFPLGVKMSTTFFQTASVFTVYRTLSRFGMQPDCDGRTDGQLRLYVGSTRTDHEED